MLKTATRHGLGKHINLIPNNAAAMVEAEATAVKKSQRSGNKIPKARTIRISENLYNRFQEHSRRYYHVETYETILGNLLDNFDKHNQDKRWWNNNTNNS